ncbi:urease accessory protein UreD [Streptomyces sp. NPDC058266]|uniref:urease accessory protein UreD n=2 Tax=unclassified Streptomyces TaxID=2593676 RepID=UPI0036E2CFAC
MTWLPEPVLAAGGCDYHVTTYIDLMPGARLLLREELLLGRHGETPGACRQRLRVRRSGRAEYDQELILGTDAPGWQGPAVTGGRRALGSLLVVDPYWVSTRMPCPLPRPVPTPHSSRCPHPRSCSRRSPRTPSTSAAGWMPA